MFFEMRKALFVLPKVSADSGIFIMHCIGLHVFRNDTLRLLSKKAIAHQKIVPPACIDKRVLSD